MEEQILSQSGLRTSQFKNTSFIYDVQIETAGSNLVKVTASAIRRYDSKTETIGEFLGTGQYDNTNYCTTLSSSLTKDETAQVLSDFYDIVAGLTK
jgi:hypothetical protein